MPRFIVIPPEEIERARILYEATEIPVDDIAKMLGISRRTLNARIRLWNWPHRDFRFAGLDDAAKRQVGQIAELAAPAIAVAENETLIDRVLCDLAYLPLRGIIEPGETEVPVRPIP